MGLGLWLSVAEIHTNVVRKVVFIVVDPCKPNKIHLARGDKLYHLMILGMVYCWVYHIIGSQNTIQPAVGDFVDKASRVKAIRGRGKLCGILQPLRSLLEFCHEMVVEVSQFHLSMAF